MSKQQLKTRTRVLTAAAAGAVLATYSAPVHAQRLKGVDISDWQGPLTQTNWNSIKGSGRDFVFLRASRGGTSGFYNESDSANNNGKNILGQRYDDLYFEQNISRAVAAGMFAGIYHFGRPDVYTNQFNPGDVWNAGTDEATHMLQQAGPWMKPGYLPPTYDFEAGSGIVTADQNAQFSIDFSNRIFQMKGFRPAVYIGNNYASPMNSIALAPTVVASYPTLWNARWPNQADPDSIDIHNTDPADYTSTIYGPWDNAPNPADPWKFWQYASTGVVPGVSGNCDVDVFKGELEALKDQLIPALWVKDTATSTNQWTDMHNWNTDIDPSGKGPAARLPGINDTIILNSSSFSGAITIASGTHNIRKLYVSETLNLTGGSLNVNYVPFVARAIDVSPGTNAIQMSAATTISGTASLSAHTMQVDTGINFNVNGGMVTFNTINLMPHASTPGKMVFGGDMTIAGLSGATATIANGSGAGTSGSVDLGGGTRTITVTDGAAATDLLVSVPVGNGSLTKAGAGTMALTATNTLAGAVVVNNGTLVLSGNGTATSVTGFTVNSGGTLALDNSVTSNSNRVASVGNTLNGGTLAFIGNSTGENTGSVTAAQGASTIAMSGTGVNILACTSLSRSAGATLNFTGADVSNKVTFTSGVSAGNFINQGTYVNSADFAVYDSAGFVRAMVVGAGASDYVTSMTSGRHVKLSASVVSQPGITISSLNLAGATVGVDMAAGATLVFNGGVIKSGGGAGLISGGAGSSMSGSSEFVFNTVASADQLTVAIPIGGASLTKTGAGTLVLSNSANTYAGATTVAQGTLRLAAAGAIPDASALNVASGGTLEMNGISETVGNITMQDGTISGAGTLTMNGANPTLTYNGVNGGATISATGLGLGTAVGTTSMNVGDGAGANDLTISSVISDGTGVHNLTKTGAGTLHLSGTNTYTGAINVSAGTLSIASIGATALTNQPLGNSSGAITVGSAASGGTLQYSGAFAATLGRGITIGGSGGATIRSTAATLTLSQTITGSGNPLTLDTAGGDISVSGVISGAGTTLTKTGANTLTLLFNSSYTGNTIINAGTIAYPAAGSLGGSPSSTIVFGGGTLRPTAAFTETRPVTLNAGGGTIDTAVASIFSGIFSGTGGLTKTGVGTLTLSAANNYTGVTVVSGGTLNLTGSLASGNTVEIEAGASLTGTGTVNGNVTTNGAGASVAAINFSGAGNIVGTLKSTGASWNGVGTVGGAVTHNGGTFTIGASANLTAPAGFTVGWGTLAGTGTLTGNATLSNGAFINMTGAGNITGTLTVNGGLWQGNSSVAGLTTVTANSTLTVNGTLGGAGQLTLANGATLAGTGTINKTINFGSNNRIAPIANNGSLTIGAPVTWGGTNMQIYSGTFLSTVITQGDTISGSLDNNGNLNGTGTAAITTTGLLTGWGKVNKPVTITGNGVIDLDAASTWTGEATPDGTLAQTLTASGGFWNGRGVVTGLTTVTGGTFTIGASDILTANGNVSVTGGQLASTNSNSQIVGSVTYASPTSSTWGGIIAGASKTLTMNAQGTTWTLTGINTYSGATTVSDGILKLTTSSNLNGTSGVSTGMVVVVAGSAGSGHGGTVQLSGGASYNLPLTIGGGGVDGVSINTNPALQNRGALDSVSGSNTWAGNISLAGTGSSGTDPLINQVSAASGATLVLSGVLSSPGGGAFAKSLEGDVVLTGASANNYSGLTRLYGGRLIIEKDSALGGAGTTNAAGGNTFQLDSASTLAFRAPASSPAGFTYSTFEWLHTWGTGAPGFGQIDNLGGANVFTGNIGLLGPTDVGTGMITSTIGASSGSLELSGKLFARTGGANNIRNIVKVGAGTLILSGNSNGGNTNSSDADLATGSRVTVSAGVLQLKGSFALPAATSWVVNPAGTLRKSGDAGTISLASTTVTNDGVVDVQSGTLDMPAIDGAGSVTVTGSALSANRLRQNSLSVNNGVASINTAGNDNATSKLATASFSNGGKLDLKDNDLVVTGMTEPAVEALVKSGFGNFDWLGSGITSSTAASFAQTDASRALGVIRADDWGYATFSGQTVNGTDVLVKYTWTGDANVDGLVDNDDFGQFLYGFSGGGSPKWLNGDFDFSGVVDNDDFGAFIAGMTAFNASGNMQLSESLQSELATFATANGIPLVLDPAPVPEPTVLMPLALAGLLARRRPRTRRDSSKPTNASEFLQPRS